MNANRSRSPLAYLLPHRVETILASFGVRAPPPALIHRSPGITSIPVSRVPHTDPQMSGTCENGANLSASPGCCGRFRSPAPSSQYVRSDSADEGRPQVLVNRLLGDPERTTDPYGI